MFIHDTKKDVPRWEGFETKKNERKNMKKYRGAFKTLFPSNLAHEELLFYPLECVWINQLQII